MNRLRKLNETWSVFDPVERSVVEADGGELTRSRDWMTQRPAERRDGEGLLDLLLLHRTQSANGIGCGGADCRQCGGEASDAEHEKRAAEIDPWVGGADIEQEGMDDAR